MPETTAQATDQPGSSAEVKSTGASSAETKEEESSTALNSEPTGEESENEGDGGEGEGGEETGDPAAEDADWLPDEQAREFPREVINEFAQRRYPKLWERLKQNPNDEDLLQVLKDKLNTDIGYKQLREQLESEAEEEPTHDGEEETETEEKPADPAKQSEAYQQRVQDLVKTTFKPEAMDAIGQNIVEAVVAGVFGIDQKALQDPNLSEDEKANMQRIVANSATVAKSLGPKLAHGMADAVISVLPHVLGDAIEAIYPGTRQSFQTRMVSEAWDAVRNQKDGSGQPLYKNLPAFGARDGDFGKLIQKAEQQMGLKPGGLSQMVMKGNNGQPLSDGEQLRIKYEMVARIANGQRLTPAEAAKLIDKGKKQAADAQRARSQRKALGAGKPSAGGFEGGGDDDFLKAIKDYNSSQQSSERR